MHDPQPAHYSTLPARSSTYDLGTTINPYAFSLTLSLTENITGLSCGTPENHSDSLREIIAANEGITPDNVFIGNGSSFLLWHFLRVLAPREILFIGPVPSEYLHICKHLQILCSAVTVLAEDDFLLSPAALQQLWDTSADLIVMPSPSACTGTVFPSLQAVFSMIRAPRVLMDTSLLECISPTPLYSEQTYAACQSYLRPGVSLFHLQDFSSFYACPGLCLSCILGDKHPIAALRLQTPDFAMPSFSQVAGAELLQSRHSYRATLPAMTASLMDTARTLRRSPLFEPSMVFEGPSFVCAKLSKPSSAPHLVKLLATHHLRIFDYSSVLYMPGGFIRISAVPGDCLALFEQALSIAASDLVHDWP